jgi:pimeloyl-ACP methyl ester carboxylesterase
MVLIILWLSMAFASGIPTAVADNVRKIGGQLSSGASYNMLIPDHWNGAVLLFNHGFRSGPKNPVLDVEPENPEEFDPPFYTLLHLGYAVIGSNYSQVGWAVEVAVADQLAVLDEYEKRFGRASRTITFGESMGGLITVKLIEQHPARFDGAMPMCGSVAGVLGMNNQALDAAFALKWLVDPESSLRIVDVKDVPSGPVTPGDEHSVGDEPEAMFALLEKAAATPQGRARALLASVFNQITYWTDPEQPQPGNNINDEMLEEIQTRMIEAFPMGGFFPRRSIESRAGGNGCWNTGIDYRVQLQKSGQTDLVKRAYDKAGLNLDEDLETLVKAPRIAADPRALDYLWNHYVPNGNIHRPVLTLHTVADPLTPSNYEAAYAQFVDRAGRRNLLRTVFTNYSGHCAFTEPQTAAAIQALDHRITSGSWEKATVDELNRVAERIGSADKYKTRTAESWGGAVDARFTDFKPIMMLRPCSRCDCEGKP